MGKALVLGLVLILGLNFVALAFHLYPTVTWLDALLHFIGGVWVAAFFFWFFIGEKFPTADFWLKALFAVSFVALIGVLWELTEVAFLNYLMAKIFGAQETTAGLADTLGDLALDLVGGLIVAATYSYYEIRNSRR